MDNIVGETFNELKVIDIVDSEHLLCECSCGDKTIVEINNLINGDIKSCGHIQNTPVNITGKYFGEWYVHSYAGSRQWNVQCSCGTKDIKDGGKLRNGYTKSCKKCARLIDLKDKTFGELKVIRYLGNRYWECKCSCKNIIKVVGADLRSGHTKSCGHATTAFKDLYKQRFGKLVAEEFLGDGLWRCSCDCGNDKFITHRTRLLNGAVQSCGCNSVRLRQNTMMQRYQEVSSAKINNKRNYDQIYTLGNRVKMIELIDSFGKKPDIAQICVKLNVQKSAVLRAIHKFELENYVVIGSNKSKYEHELYDIIKSINNNLTILLNDRQVLRGKELDLYIPELKLAIEFNGNLYHSSIYKDKKYHQLKSIECAKKNIQLLHIFEYEWIDNKKREKLIQLISNKILNNTERIYARNTIVKEIDYTECKDFLDKHHLQNSAKASVYIGTFFNNKLIGVITFGNDRFSHSNSYEIIRLCYDSKVTPIGCTNKMFKYFVDKYKPSSIITYSDISKFTGNTYLKIGFKLDKITEPNYVWVDYDNSEVLSRYQTQKHKLIELELGTEEETEDEIMSRMDYLKIYDAGNYKLIWENEYYF